MDAVKRTTKLRRPRGVDLLLYWLAHDENYVHNDGRSVCEIGEAKDAIKRLARHREGIGKMKIRLKVTHGCR
jgi:hypothetical protein